MNKKIMTGVLGLVAVAGVAGLVANTTYARGGGMMRGNGDGIRNATSTAAFAQQRSVMTAQHEAMQKAIDAGDYTAWKTAADALVANGKGTSMSTIVTQANWAKFVEMHKLMTQADTIRKEIGLDQGNGFGPGMGGRGGMMGMHRATTTSTTSQ